MGVHFPNGRILTMDPNPLLQNPKLNEAKHAARLRVPEVFLVGDLAEGSRDKIKELAGYIGSSDTGPLMVILDIARGNVTASDSETAGQASSNDPTYAAVLNDISPLATGLDLFLENFNAKFNAPTISTFSIANKDLIREAVKLKDHITDKDIDKGLPVPKEHPKIGIKNGIAARQWGSVLVGLGYLIKHAPNGFFPYSAKYTPDHERRKPYVGGISAEDWHAANSLWRWYRGNIAKSSTSTGKARAQEKKTGATKSNWKNSAAIAPIFLSEAEMRGELDEKVIAITPGNSASMQYVQDAFKDKRLQSTFKAADTTSKTDHDRQTEINRLLSKLVTNYDADDRVSQYFNFKPKASTCKLLALFLLALALLC